MVGEPVEPLVQAGKVIPRKNFHALEVFDIIENTFGFEVKYITKEHLRTFAQLDPVDGHNDPSDRLIKEGMVIK